MKKYRLSLIVMMLAGILLCCPLIGNSDVYAEEEATQKQMLALEKITNVNPLYKGEVDDSDVPKPRRLLKSGASGEEEYNICDTVEEAAVFIRGEMVRRMPSVKVGVDFVSEESTVSDTCSQLMYELMDEAMKHTGKPTEGDYLRWHYGMWSTVAGVFDEENNFIRGTAVSYDPETGEGTLLVEYEISYYTTFAQENAVADEIETLLSSEVSDDMTDAQKVERVYRWMMKNIIYKDTGENMCHTAYSGICKRECVCQGFASLMYRVLLEEGINNRVYGGTASADAVGHVWNIIRLGEHSYWIDVTWDENGYAATDDSMKESYEYKYFLKGGSVLTGHEMYVYPYYEVSGFDPSPVDYVGSCDELGHSATAGRVLTKATIAADGKIEKVCSRCHKVLGTAAIPKPTFALSTTAYTYNGKAKTPGVTGKGVQAFEFSALYPSGRKNVGTYKITLKVTKGNDYIAAGSTTKTVSFKINPKKATIKTPAKGKTYVTVKWKRQSSKMSTKRITGYQVQLATDKKFTKGVKTYKVKGYKKTYKKISKLKKKKTYYVRVRTYLGSYYSGWSSIKTAKTR